MKTSDPSPSGVARLGHGLLTAVFILFVFAPVVTVVLLVANPGGGKTTITVNASSENLQRLPETAELASTVPVDVDVSDPSGKQVLGILLAGAVPHALLIFVVYELRKIVSTVRRGDPFVPDNVRRLRWIGYALIGGGPLVQLFSQLFLQAVAESEGVYGFAARYDLPPLLSLVGIGVLVLAQVFAQGVRLREDVEGTV